MQTRIHEKHIKINDNIKIPLTGTKEHGIKYLRMILAPMKNGHISAIRFSTLEAICDVLDCQPGDILEYERTKSDE